MADEVKTELPNVSKFSLPDLSTLKDKFKDFVPVLEKAALAAADSALVAIDQDVDKLNFGVADPYVKLVFKLAIPQLRALLHGTEAQPVVRNMLEVANQHKEEVK